MCLIYLISFVFSIWGVFGVGHLFAGAPSKAVGYFVAGLIWFLLSLIVGGVTGGTAALCLVPLHLLFCHFCAADAIRVARGAA